LSKKKKWILNYFMLLASAALCFGPSHLPFQMHLALEIAIELHGVVAMSVSIVFLACNITELILKEG
jgi:hypothetical protein